MTHVEDVAILGGSLPTFEGHNLKVKKVEETVR